jgi:hypothetical protein
VRVCARVWVGVRACERAWVCARVCHKKSLNARCFRCSVQSQATFAPFCIEDDTKDT